MDSTQSSFYSGTGSRKVSDISESTDTGPDRRFLYYNFMDTHLVTKLK
jgi:hypothetical protein